ncbi:unnamed protein product [Thelazia callipaeda]|uniref:TIL domain-containing protein n=1 Tax=Thelazia callipaeda TaxID=103827 RepID=A0A0N5CQ84_THECL|nr:unnamed protein product [Thelazia callipaeda]
MNSTTSSKSNLLLKVIITLFVNQTLTSALIRNPKSFQSCKAGCSPHLTLPCNFGSFDRCIMESCRAACWKDNHRKVRSCFCRGSLDGGTLRACFCGFPDQENISTPTDTLHFIH